MITNADCTIYHKTYDPCTRLDRWAPTSYPAVNWYGRQAVSIGDKGVSAASVYTVRIPTSDEVAVSTGDIVVKGLVADAITGPAPLFKAYPCFEVTAVSDNRRGSPAAQHWKIEGK